MIGISLVGISNEFLASLILIAGLALAMVIYLTLKRLGKKVEGTHTVWASVAKGISKPLAVAIALAAIYETTILLPVTKPYLQEIEIAFYTIEVLVVALIVVKLITHPIEWYARKKSGEAGRKDDRHLVPMVHKAAYVVVYAIALIWLFTYLGIDMTAAIAALGIGGLAVALALQSTLSNLFAGAYIAIDRPIGIGDYVELNDKHKGYVEDIGWRSTRIRMLQNNMVVIPNSQMAESIVINYSLPQEEMAIVIPVGVSYKSDLERVEKVTIEVANEVQQNVEGAIKKFKPFIRFGEFGNSNINFSVILRVNEFVHKYLVTNEFMKRLKRRYDKEGIEISFPCTNVYMRE